MTETFCMYFRKTSDWAMAQILAICHMGIPLYFCPNVCKMCAGILYHVPCSLFVLGTISRSTMQCIMRPGPIPAWINVSIHYKVWDEITYPFPNFNDATVEIRELISNFTPFYCGYDCLSMLGIKLNHVCKRGPRQMLRSHMKSHNSFVLYQYC